MQCVSCLLTTFPVRIKLLGEGMNAQGAFFKRVAAISLFTVTLTPPQQSDQLAKAPRDVNTFSPKIGREAVSMRSLCSHLPPNAPS